MATNTTAVQARSRQAGRSRAGPWREAFGRARARTSSPSSA